MAFIGFNEPPATPLGAAGGSFKLFQINKVKHMKCNMDV